MRIAAKKNARKGKDSNLYGKIFHGKGCWYNCKQGSSYFMRSTWEVKYAIYLDSIFEKWFYEYKKFEIIVDGIESTYTPDFYLPDKELFIEIKGYWRKDAKKKYKVFKETYPNIKINIYGKKELKQLGAF